MTRERIIIIDGSGYIFRAFFAIQRLSTSKGFPTNAVFGFVNMLSKVLEMEKPTKLAIAFDTGKAPFRKEIYADYKANRSAFTGWKCRATKRTT
jgi:DNA polymerase-1